MNKVIFITAIFISIVFAACGGGTLSPKAFNDSAIKIFEGANKTLDEFDGKITAGVKSNDVASIAVAADSALAKINIQIEKLNALNAPQNGEEYKEAVLKSLDAVKVIIETGKKYSALKEGYSRSEFNALEKEYNKNRKSLSEKLKDVAKVQAEFAKASGAKTK